jgi:hypothetical protein
MQLIFVKKLLYNKSSYVWIVFRVAELSSSFQTTTVTEAQILPHNKEGEMNEHVARVGGSTEMLRATVRGFSGKN